MKIPNKQSYPRGADGLLLDITQLPPFKKNITSEELREFINAGVIEGNQKLKRKLLNINEKDSPQEIDEAYKKAAKEIFKHFKRANSNPALTSVTYKDKHYSEIAKKHFSIMSLQKNRMNAGWTYQMILYKLMKEAGRFTETSDLGVVETDFHAKMILINHESTISGGKWRGAIEKLETAARKEKNRIDTYLCIFALTLDFGKRRLKRDDTGNFMSFNTELWKEDCWTLFTGIDSKTIQKACQDYYSENSNQDDLVPELPLEVIEHFGQLCDEKCILNEAGIFHDSDILLSYFMKG
jgi:hypothetical protein